MLPYFRVILPASELYSLRMHSTNEHTWARRLQITSEVPSTTRRRRFFGRSILFLLPAPPVGRLSLHSARFPKLRNPKKDDIPVCPSVMSISC